MQRCSAAAGQFHDPENMKRQQPTERQPCIIRNLARADPISEAAVQFAPVPGVSGESLLARPAKMSDDNHMPFQEKDQDRIRVA